MYPVRTFRSIKKNRIIATFSAIILFFIGTNRTHAQDSLRFLEPAPDYVKSRGVILGASLGSVYVLSMTGLYSLWYKDYPKSEFQFFDDNAEWLQVDKVGHVGSAYYLGKWGIDLFSWTGMERRKAIWYGGTAGLVFLTTVEVFDGFSAEWGFSTGDMIANVAGTAMVISQQLAWEEQRIKIKFSFHETKYAQYRPNLLGSNYIESMFKDYNGQTYWLSGNIHSFLKTESKFPRWLNVSVGYGAEGMVGARSNFISQEENFTNTFKRYRQFYFSPDIDLTKIKTRSKTLKTIFGVVGFIKIPAPAIELREGGKVKMHWLYF